MFVDYGYGKNNKMCLVIRVAIGFRTGYHYVKLTVVEQKYITEGLYCFLRELDRKLF